MKSLISRKDIAVILDVSAKQVETNERRWGLHVCRKDLNKRCVRYVRHVAIAILKNRGFLN